MTGIVSSAYGATYAQNHYSSGVQTQQQETVTRQASHESSATKVTLSAAGKAALAANDKQSSDQVYEQARRKLSDILTQFNRASPLSDGKLNIDLSTLSRAEMFAVASNAGNKFTLDEQKAAKQELKERFDNALSGAESVMRITGSYKDLYEEAIEYLNAAGPEERKTSEWHAQHAAVTKALEQMSSTFSEGKPSTIKNDPVADYLSSEAKSKRRNILDIAADARTVIDRVYSQSGNINALKDFGSRTLSAIALNKSDKFSSSEISAAKTEMKARVGKNVQGAFQSAGGSGDPTAFSKKLIAQYASMSSEEREAAGMTKDYYNTIVKNYETSLKISQAFGSSFGGGSLSLANYL
ncbi:MAG: hypothetical protein AB3N28_06675 [Kordiimonas sp.]